MRACNIYALCAAILLVFSAPASWNAYARTSLLSTSETQYNNLTPFKKWTGMIERYDEQNKSSTEECGHARYYPCEVNEWKSMIETLKHKPLRSALDEVNRYVNSHPYILDPLNWGTEDYWETPYEFLAVNGDCEDYAIAKFYSLRMLGVPEEKMRLLIVQDTNLGGIVHAILGVYDGKEFLILDNQTEEVMPATKIYHYKPIYALNEDHWWSYDQKN